MINYLEKCSLCPRNCGVNRNNNETGYCKALNKLRIGRASLHLWEEPCISGTVGSGTIFFSFCNLNCIYCQNSELSHDNIGKDISIERFSDICLDLQTSGAHNINLVSPTHYIPLLKEGLTLAKEKGLVIPIIYNTSSYDNVESLKLLEGLIDIYLADLKYYYDDLAISLSDCPNYFSFATDAINEMVRQVPQFAFSEDGLMLKGIIVRHLILPKHSYDSKKVIKYLFDTYHDNIFISIMNQYTKVKDFEKESFLNEKLSDEEYQSVIDYAIQIGIRNGFIQEGETDQLSFIPHFDCTGV